MFAKNRSSAARSLKTITRCPSSAPAASASASVARVERSPRRNFGMGSSGSGLARAGAVTDDDRPLSGFSSRAVPASQ